MGQIDNLAQGSLDDIFRRLRALEFSTNQNNMAIGRGGLRVHSGGVISIENGGLVVTGSAEIIGTLIASGIINFTGEVTISGPLDVSGLMTLMSDLVVSSGGKITAGSIELNPDGSAQFGTMTISPAGVITSGNVVIDPSDAGGGFTFASGGGVGGNAGVVALRGASDAGLLAGVTAALFAGGTQVTVGDGYVDIDGLPTVSGETANVWQDPANGRLYRIV